MRNLLTPFSWLYKLIVVIRNFLYDAGWLRSFRFDFPVICIGNISTGGTGKTPHIIYLAKALQDKYKAAVISRGYRRKSKGYILAASGSLVADIGDEPKLIKYKMPAMEVAVCENRLIGISTLLQDVNDLVFILMDDGFQHRKVKAGLNIILSSYDALFIHDKLLPAGNLREPVSSLVRADTIIITKCSPQMQRREASELRTTLQLLPLQKLYFTSLGYGELNPLFPLWQNEVITKGKQALVVTGIANDRHLVEALRNQFTVVHKMHFPDHHYFSEKDLQNIKNRLGDNSVLITTEKDAMRLMEQEEIIKNLNLQFYILPVEVQFLFNAEQQFLEDITAYIHRDVASF